MRRGDSKFFERSRFCCSGKEREKKEGIGLSDDSPGKKKYRLQTFEVYDSTKLGNCVLAEELLCKNCRICLLVSEQFGNDKGYKASMVIATKKQKTKYRMGT